MTPRALVASVGSWTPLRQSLPYAWLIAIAAASATILLPAIWNGFPFMFYDTGAFIDLAMQGGFIAERSAFYGMFLSAFWPRLSLWPAMIVQVAMTVYVMVEFARVLLPNLSPVRFFAVVAVLSVATGLPWYAAQVLPDILAPLMVLCLYLLGFHAAQLNLWRKAALAGVAILAITSHASHLGLGAGLVGVVILIQLAIRFLPARFMQIPPMPATSVSPGWKLPALVLALSLIAMVASNFARTGDIFISRAGPAFVVGRLVQDGIVKRLLDDTCPGSGYRLCAYKDELPKTANDYLWGASPFHKLGDFEGTADESRRIISDSLRLYPLLHVKMAVRNTLEQLTAFETGDGIEPLNDIPVPAMTRHIPDQIDGYRASRQQQDLIDFRWINAVHVPIGALSIAVLAVILMRAAWKRAWGDGLFLPVFLLLALLGNAFICGALSNPNDRYQSRLMWAVSFSVLLLVPRYLGSPFSRIRPAPELAAHTEPALQPLL